MVNKWFFKILVISLFIPLKSYSISDTLKVESDSDLNKLVTKNMKVIILDQGDYFLNNTLLFNNDIEIIGNGKVIISSHNFLNILIQANANLQITNVTLDGKGQVPYGALTKGNVTIINCNFQNFFGNKKMSGIGLRSNTSGKKIQISGSTFRDISGFEDGKEGNSIGANRALFLRGGNISITNCFFRNILGTEDSDVIHVQDIETKKMKFKMVIRDCSFENFGKRAIKVNVSNNSVDNNTFINVSNPASVVLAFIGSSNNVVFNNNFNVYTKLGVASFSNSFNNRVESNRIIFKPYKSQGIFYFKSVRDFIIRDNAITINGKLENLVRKGNNNIKNVNFSEVNNKILIK